MIHMCCVMCIASERTVPLLRTPSWMTCTYQMTLLLLLLMMMMAAIISFHCRLNRYSGLITATVSTALSAISSRLTAHTHTCHHHRFHVKVHFSCESGLASFPLGFLLPSGMEEHLLGMADALCCLTTNNSYNIKGNLYHWPQLSQSCPKGRSIAAFMLVCQHQLLVSHPHASLMQ